MRDRFRVAGVPNAEGDARLLARLAFGWSDLQLLQHEQDGADGAALARLEDFARRRLAGTPVARLAGQQEFYGLDFVISPQTLVPRPETEMLVDFARAVLPGGHPARVLDLGTGSGCIAIAILAGAPLLSAVATDRSDEALSCAALNANAHDVAARIELRSGSWFAPVGQEERFDLIVSNPPYIESVAIRTLMPEVREHDPALALDGGPDGLEAYRQIVAGAPAHLRPGGWLALEIGAEQGARVAGLVAGAGLAEVSVKKDLAGLDRVVIGHHV